MKRKLICIFVLIGCIPLLLASFYFYSHIYSNVMKQNDLESENNLSASKSAILNTVEDRVIVLRTLALPPAMLVSEEKL
jgi:hypothetical protein